MGIQPIRMQLGKILQEIVVGKSCGKMLQEISCRKLLQENLAGIYELSRYFHTVNFVFL